MVLSQQAGHHESWRLPILYRQVQWTERKKLNCYCPKGTHVLLSLSETFSCLGYITFPNPSSHLLHYSIENGVLRSKAQNISCLSPSENLQRRSGLSSRSSTLSASDKNDSSPTTVTTRRNQQGDSTTSLYTYRQTRNYCEISGVCSLPLINPQTMKKRTPSEA